MSDGKFQTQNQSQMIETTLGLLDAVHAEDGPSQRHLASRLGVALGLTNTLLKRCVKKGLLKISQAPARRYVYYLTPQGFKEKSRLTTEYLMFSLDFFRRARSEYADVMQHCKARGWNRIALFGATDLTEIAILAAREVEMEIMVVIEPGMNMDQFSNLPVVCSLDEANAIEPLDAVIVTDTQDPQKAFNTLKQVLSDSRVMTPPLLHVSRSLPNEPETDDTGADR